MSEIKVTSYTNPIPAQTLVPQPFSYPSGGTSAGGITKAEMGELLTTFFDALDARFGTQLDTIITLLQHLSDNSDQLLADADQIKSDTGSLAAWQVKISDFQAAMTVIEAKIDSINTLTTTLLVPTIQTEAAGIVTKLSNIGGTVNAHIV